MVSQPTFELTFFIVICTWRTGPASPFCPTWAASSSATTGGTKITSSTSLGGRSV